MLPLGESHGGKIQLRPDLPPAEHFEVLVHELAHEKLHQGIQAARPPETVRETEAEAVAHVVATAIGLDSRAAAADYIQLYQGNIETLRQSLTNIQHTAHTILEALNAAVYKRNAAEDEEYPACGRGAVLHSSLFGT